MYLYMQVCARVLATFMFTLSSSLEAVTTYRWFSTCGHQSTSRTAERPPDENTLDRRGEKETEKLLVEPVKQELFIAVDATTI